jgi:hypothetical protein
MKRAIIFFCVLVFGTTMLMGQAAGPKFTYSKDVIDLGTLYADELDLTKIDIEFSNQGNQPLVVSQVRGCCGTRVTKWTTEPVNPEGKGTISIEFRLAPRAQNISRTVTATSNDPASNTIIRIIGKVVEGSSKAQN